MMVLTCRYVFETCLLIRRREQFLVHLPRACETWVTFGINLAINMTYLYTLKLRADGCPAGEVEFVNRQGWHPHNAHGSSVCVADWAKGFMLFLNCSQITLSIFTLILYVIVRCPAIYNLTKETKER